MIRGMASLWAITCLFRPTGSVRREQNFRRFRNALSVPLVAVELSFDGRFVLEEGDADRLIRVSDGDIMWQKERLLNLAMRALPPECRQVAVLDCDVLFADRDWPVRARDALDRFPVVQAFSEVRHLPPDDDAGGITLTQVSAASRFVRNGRLPAVLNADGQRTGDTAAGGFAWLFRREILDMHGLFDRCIIGGGDSAMLHAAAGDPERVCELHWMNPRQADCYRSWASGFHASVQGGIGCLDGALLHLWHGALAARQPRERHAHLRRYEFDPVADLRAGPSDPWKWATDKPDLHAYLREYFLSRAEDDAP